MPWCRGGGPKPRGNPGPCQCQGPGDQAHPICSPDPHLLGPPCRKLRDDRLQACPQPPIPGHHLQMAQQRDPHKAGVLLTALFKTREGAEVWGEEARPRP